MTAPVFVQPFGAPRFCRLLTIGIVAHVTACRSRIDALEPMVLTPTRPPRELMCPGCWRDLMARTSTRDLRPSVGEIGVEMDSIVEVGA